MQFLRDQLTFSEPEWNDVTDAEKFSSYRDHQQLIQILMALHHNFEPTRAALLY